MSSTPRDSWRAKQDHQRRDRISRDLRRLGIVLGLALLAVALITFLFPPFFAPRTHLVLIGTGIVDSLDAPVIPFVASDQQAMQAVEATTAHRHPQLWAQPRTAGRVQQVIQNCDMGHHDTMLVYLSAHGVSEDGDAYLLCENFDLRRPDSGRIKIDSLLQQVRQSPAATKVVLLNAGTIDYDPRMGILINEFPRLLRQAVHNTEDPSLWVYCSHAPGEYSHVSRAAERSVFGMFLSEGLRGAADLNRNGKVSLQELTRFTSANVSQWVSQSSDRAASQTPVLLWGGGSELPAESPLLLTRPAGAEPYQIDIASLLRQDRADEASDTMSRQNNQQSGILRRTHRSLHSPTVAMQPPTAPTSPVLAPAVTTNSLPRRSLPTTTITAPRISTPTVSARGVSSSSLPAPTSLATNATVAGRTSLPTGSAAGGEPSGQAPLATAVENSTADQTPATGTDPSTETAESQQDQASQTDAGDGQRVERDLLAQSRQLLAEAWQLRDIASTEWSLLDLSINPIENVPHLWREYEAELLGIEQQLRSSADIDPKPIEAILRTAIGPKNAGPESPQTPLAILWQPAQLNQVIDFGIAPSAAHSVALAEWMSGIQGESLGIDMTGLQLALQRDTRKELDEWMTKNWQDRLSSYEELRLIKQLTETPELDWELLSVAARTSLVGQRVAVFDMLSPGWVRPNVDKGDQHRYAAETLLFLQVGRQWRSHAREQLRLAAAAYAAGESVFVTIRRSQLIRNLAFAKLPSYLRWYQRSQASSGDNHPRQVTLAQLIATLQQLSSHLQHPDTSTVSQVEQLALKLEQSLAKIEAPLSDTSVTRLVERTAIDGDAWQAEQILLTSLVAASIRQKLLAATGNIDRDVMITYQPVRLSPANETDQNWQQEIVPLNASDWKSLMELARLELSHAQLGDVAGVEDQSSRISRTWSELEQRHNQAASENFDESTQPAALEKLWTAYRGFAAALANHYRQQSQPAVVAGSNSEVQAERSARALRMIDPRDAWRLRDWDMISLTRVSRLRSSFLWQATRLDLAAAASQWDDVASLLAAAARYRGTRPGPPINLSGPAQLDLQYHSASDFELTLDNPGPDNLAVTLRYDHDIIDITPLDHAPESAGTLQAQGADFNLNAPGESEVRVMRQAMPSGQLSAPPRAKSSYRFRVVRKNQSTQSTTVIIDAHQRTGGSAVESTNSPDLSIRDTFADQSLIARHTIKVSLPVAELVVAHSMGTHVSASRRMELNPFANRLNTYRFGIVNRSLIKKRVAIELYSLDQPLADANLDDYQELVSKLTAVSELKVSTAADGEVAFPVAGDDAEPKAEADKPPQDAGAPPAEQPAADKNIALPSGLLAVLTDLDSGQRTFREIDFAVQRPRRFLRPLVEFDASANRITIQVTAIDRDLLPAGAPVRLRCRLADDLPGGLRGKLEGEIHRSSPVTRMFINMPSPPPQTVRLLLDVDDYPRAFIFDVPTGRHVNRVPELTNLVDVRPSVESDQGYLAAIGAIPVKVEVDAPVGSFEDGSDVIEFRINSGTAEDLESPPLVNPALPAPPSLTPPSLTPPSLTPPSLTPPEPVPAPQPLPDPKPELESLPAPAGELVSLRVALQTDDATSPIRAPQPPISAPIVRLRTDRSVQLGIVDSKPDGTVRILAGVSDFNIDLATNRLENIGFDVATTIQVGGDRSHRIAPIPLYIDTAPPLVGPVEPINFAGFVPVGRTMVLSVWAWDAGCGMARVEATLDVDGSGEFPPEGKFTQATRRTGREWLLEFNAGPAPGSQTLLVRGIDRVGNACEPVRVPLEVVSLTEGIALTKQQTVEVAGSVFFREELVPSADVKLMLVPETEGELPNPDNALVVKTNDSGRYSIPSVSPGKYLLGGRGVIRNRVRRIERELTIEPGPRRTVHADIALP